MKPLVNDRVVGAHNPTLQGHLRLNTITDSG